MTAAKFKILQDRWAQILGRPLMHGSHTSNAEQANLEMCVMEATAYVAGLAWSDHPECTCPTLTEFMISWNDGLPSDAERDRLLKPLIPKLVGTKSTTQVAERRSYMALDWLIRVHTPKWLELVPALHEHAKALRALPKIADMAGATAAGERVRLARTDAAAARDAAWAAAWDAAWAAARDAAWDAARDAAGDAAGDAARDAAGDAARAAARDAAWAAAGDAAGDAARAAARDAAWAAAGDAARAALKPTQEWLQTSALDLFERMVAVSEPS